MNNATQTQIEKRYQRAIILAARYARIAQKDSRFNQLARKMDSVQAKLAARLIFTC